MPVAIGDLGPVSKGGSKFVQPFFEIGTGVPENKPNGEVVLECECSVFGGQIVSVVKGVQP